MGYSEKCGIAHPYPDVFVINHEKRFKEQFFPGMSGIREVFKELDPDNVESNMKIFKDNLEKILLSANVKLGD